VAQLGAGFGTNYPLGIDTAQTYVNGVPTAPDSNTRIDSELLNDILATLLAIEMTLGASPQGNLGSVAARLNQYLPGIGSASSLLDFVNRINVVVTGVTHRLGTRGLMAQLYTNAVPAAAFEPDMLTVDQATYDLLAQFADPMSGSLIIAGAAPYIQDFAAATTVTVLGSAHAFASADLHYRLYDNTQPAGLILGSAVFAPSSITVHPSTFDVVVTFDDPMTGYLVLSKAAPQYAASFTGQTTVTVTGSTHGLGTRALLFQVWDASTPRQAIAPATLTVHPTTYDVVATFDDPTSGRLVLGSVADFSGTDFEIRDGGVVNQTATRLYSRSGDLDLQMGTGGHLYMRSKLSAILATLTEAGQLGLGVTAPTHQLELSTDSAAKPSSSSWTIFSDERLKDVLRPYTDGLAMLLQLEPLWYRYNGQGGMPKTTQEHVGLLAQALQGVAPYMVHAARSKLTPESEDTDILSVDNHAFTYALINAVKELHGRVTTLEQAVAVSQAVPAEETDAC